MRIYLAGTPGIREREVIWQEILLNRLLSFWDIYKNSFEVNYAFELIKSRIKKNENLSCRKWGAINNETYLGK